MNEKKRVTREDRKRILLWRRQNDFTDFLRSEIMSGMILPGEKLMSAGEMARLFHVSIFKVNDTISTLKKEKLIVYFPKKGYFVSGYRHDRISEHIIGVVSNGGAMESMRRMYDSMETVLNSCGYDMQVRNAGNSQAKEEKIIRSFLAAQVDGVIIEPSSSQMLCRHMELYRRLDRQQIPYIFVNSVYPQMMDKPRVSINDFKGGYVSTRHLIATGRMNIVGVFKSDDSRGNDRHRGYVAALQEAGMPYRPELVIWYQTEERDRKARVALNNILETEQGFDGIVCYDDNMARSVMYFLFSKGCKIPEDIGVVGYGNSVSAEAGEMGITTVALPNARLGEMASRLILERIEGVDDAASTVERVLEPELVIRSSSVGSAV